VPGHPVTVPEEARAEHVVGAPLGDVCEHALEVDGGIFAVAVEVDGGRVPLVAGELEPGSQGGSEAARGALGEDARPRAASDRGGRIARAVVHEQPVDPHAARLIRDAGEHLADGRLLVPGDDDGETARRLGGLHHPVDGRQQWPPARRGRGLHAEELRDRDRQLANRPGLTHHRPRHGSGAPDEERHGAFPPVEVAVAADAASLPMVGHKDHGGALEPAAFLEKCEEIAHVAVRLGELVEVLGAADTADVTELIGAK
jgi:hypothetical protein